MMDSLTARLAALLFVLGVVFGAAIAASAHTATHHHAGVPHAFLQDGTNTAHVAFLNNCEWIDNTRGWKRREWHQHYSRSYPGASWTFQHGVQTGGLAPCF
jgi:hypothetical protein